MKVGMRALVMMFKLMKGHPRTIEKGIHAIMKMRNTRAKHNVPLDVWGEILSWLPVNSLLRFRCVSKSWKLLIDDPDFCHLHLNRFKNNSEETHLVFLQGRVTRCFIRCSKTYEATRKLGCLGRWDRSNKIFRSTATPGYDGSWFIWFSVDGLVLLKSALQRTELMLWNPSIRKCRILPPSPDSDKREIVDLGLGFDPVNKDYKLVRVALHCRNVCGVAIYTVGTDSWKTIQYQVRGCSNRSWPSYAHTSVYFRGCLYFISSSKELVSFDLSIEVFTFANLPEYHEYYSRESLFFVDGGSSLAVFRYTISGGTLWALENPSSSDTSFCWTKRCTITRRIPKCFHLKRSGDLLLLSDDGRQLISYNIETQEKKLLPKSSCSKVTNQVRSYKESLVLLK